MQKQKPPTKLDVTALIGIVLFDLVVTVIILGAAIFANLSTNARINALEKRIEAESLAGDNLCDVDHATVMDLLNSIELEPQNE